MIKKILAVIALCTLTTTAFGLEHMGKVTALLVSQGVVSLHIEANAPPQCGGGAVWQFNYNLSTLGGKEWFSMLLAARASGTLVTIGYQSNPADICQVAYIVYH